MLHLKTYAYIAGYTSGGFPYGATWEELEQYANQDSLDAALPPLSRRPHACAADDRGRPYIKERDDREVPFDLPKNRYGASGYPMLCSSCRAAAVSRSGLICLIVSASAGCPFQIMAAASER